MRRCCTSASFGITNEFARRRGRTHDLSRSRASGICVKAGSTLAEACIRASAILGARGTVFTAEGIAAPVAASISAASRDAGLSTSASAVVRASGAVFTAEFFAGSVATKKGAAGFAADFFTHASAVFRTGLAVFALVGFALVVAAGWGGTTCVEAVETRSTVAVDRARGAVFACIAGPIPASATASVVTEVAVVALAVLWAIATVFVVSATSISTSQSTRTAYASFVVSAFAVLWAVFAVLAILYIADAVATSPTVVGIFTNACKGLFFKLFAGAICGALAIIFTDALGSEVASSDADPPLETGKSFCAGFETVAVVGLAWNTVETWATKVLVVTDIADLSAFCCGGRWWETDGQTRKNVRAKLCDRACYGGSRRATCSCLDATEEGALAGFPCGALVVLLAQAELFATKGATRATAAIAVLVA